MFTFGDKTKHQKQRKESTELLTTQLQENRKCLPAKLSAFEVSNQ
jgi:hypothetical protein